MSQTQNFNYSVTEVNLTMRSDRCIILLGLYTTIYTNIFYIDSYIDHESFVK